MRGSLSIGVIPTVTAVDVPEVLGRFRERYPQVRMLLRTGSSDDFVTDIRADRLDVALLGLPASDVPDGVSSRPLRQERLVALVGADHRLAGRRRLRLTDLADEQFVDFPARTPGRLQSDRAFDRIGVVRDVPFEATDLRLMLDLARRGLAVVLLSPALVPADDRLRAIAVTGGPERVEHLAWSAFSPTAAARAFVAEILGGTAPGHP